MSGRKGAGPWRTTPRRRDSTPTCKGRRGLSGRCWRDSNPRLATPVALSNEEFNQLVAFLRVSLQDPKATPHNLRKLIPKSLPSGQPVAHFQ